MLNVFKVIGFALVILFGVGTPVYNLTVQGESSNCVVTGTDRVSKAKGGSSMRVYTENCGTFSVADNWFHGQFTAADTFGALEEGESYDFTTVGMRIGIISYFPNIITAKVNK